MAHARAIDGAVLTRRGRFVAEGQGVEETLEIALQGSRKIEGGTMFSSLSHEASMSAGDKLKESHVSLRSVAEL